MADDTNLNPNQPPAGDPLAPPPDGQGKKPADQPQGADTPPAPPAEAKKDDEPKVDITTTPEFKDALTKAIRDKIPQLQKQARKDVAKELSGEKEGEPTVEELKTKLNKQDERLRRYEARDQVEDFVSDKRNQVQVRNMKALIRYVEHDFEYDEQGKVTNSQGPAHSCQVRSSRVVRRSVIVNRRRQRFPAAIHTGYECVDARSLNAVSDSYSQWR